MTAVEKPQFEVADIIRLYGDDYRKKHTLPPLYIEECDTCGDQRNCYNSCRNRHCPKCQGLDNVRWVQEREDELLPIQYFHVIFTLPHELNLLAQYNQVCLYNILIQAATETLQAFADKRWKGTLAGKERWALPSYSTPGGRNWSNIFTCIPLSPVAYSPMTTGSAGSTPRKTTCSKSKISVPSIARNSATNSNRPLRAVN